MGSGEREKLIACKINRVHIEGVVERLADAPSGAVMVLSDSVAKSLSGDIISEEVKNNKTIKHTDGVNAGYWASVLGQAHGGKVAICKTCDSRYDIGCFRPGEIPLSGTIYKNDPAILSADQDGNWYFVESIHADPSGNRYKDEGLVDRMASFVLPDKVYLPTESNVGASYFRQECEQNSYYSNQMIAKGRIETR